MADYVPSLLIGPAQAMEQDVVYALPARQVRLMSVDVIQVSVDGSTYSDVADSTTGVDVTAVFAKCTTGDTTVVCRV